MINFDINQPFTDLSSLLHVLNLTMSHYFVQGFLIPVNAPELNWNTGFPDTREFA